MAASQADETLLGAVAGPGRAAGDAAGVPAREVLTWPR